MSAPRSMSRRRMPKGAPLALVLTVLLVALPSCGGRHVSAKGSAEQTTTTSLAGTNSASSRTSSPGSGANTPTTRTSPATATTPAPTTSPTTSGPASTLPAGQPLAGKVVGIDPGHNGDSYSAPSVIDRQVFNGREDEDCDTTGTETDAGYTEAEFNWNVATYLTADLRQEGAQVVLTRNSNTGVGPCVTVRSQIINEAKANDAALLSSSEFQAAAARAMALAITAYLT